MGQKDAKATDEDWHLVYQGYDPKQVSLREALCVLGNGLYATRGAAEESWADGIHYPATYIAGSFNRLSAEVEGKTVSNESLVNFPNWLPITFRCNQKEPWFFIDAYGHNILEYRLDLDIYNGILNRKMRVEDDFKREFLIESSRFVNMHTQNPHLCAIKYTITPLNYTGELQIRASLDGSVENTGIKRYNGLGSKHLEVLGVGATPDNDGIFVEVRTNQSAIEFCLASRTTVHVGKKLHSRFHVEKEEAKVHQIFTVRAEEGERITAEKIVCMYFNGAKGILNAKEACFNQVKWFPSYAELEHSHKDAMVIVWENCDIVLKGNDGSFDRLQRITRLHIFHMVQTVSLNTIGYDVSVPARGLHGESYRGHIFWDELFIIPFFSLHVPEIAKTLLRYRYYRLNRARQLAKEAGFKGAMFPWQSGSDGREESQVLHYNPLSKTWGPDLSSLQRHINIAIAFNVIRFFDTSKDGFFMEKYGAEILFDICRFWASVCTYNHETGRYEIKGVMGPDEFHEQLPNAENPGLDNNTYTNVMVVWLLKKALYILKGNALRTPYKHRLIQTLNIKQQDIDLWEAIVKKMTIVFHKDGIIWSQFQGYEQLAELDWNKYRKKYGNIERMDRILKAEGDTPDKYKVSKQPDVCMLFYLLTKKELGDIFTDLGYCFDEIMIQANIGYYLERTSHGSTISKMVFSYILEKYDTNAAWKMFIDSARSDLDDVQEGTTGEGVHLALMGGMLYTLIRKFAGVDTTQKILRIDPEMPRTLQKIKFYVQFRGVLVDISVSHKRVKVSSTWNFFPIIIQDVTMLASEQPFRKRIYGQPLGEPFPDQQPLQTACDKCKTAIFMNDNHICRSCGRDMCPSCLKHHVGWYNMLIPDDPDIKVCSGCRETIDHKDKAMLEEEDTPLQRKAFKVRVRSNSDAQQTAMSE